MGNVKSCANPASDPNVVAIGKKDTKAYQWWGMKVLSASCQSPDGPGFVAELNICGIIAVALVALIVLGLIWKMMSAHRKDLNMA